MSDYAGGQGNVEFKESIGLQLVVKFDQWLKGLAESEKAMNAFGVEATKVAAGLTTTFVNAQRRLEKTASNITGVFKTIRNDLAKTTSMWGTASLAMAQHATTIQRSMFALEKTALSTGRSFSAQMKLIEDSIGGVASRAELLASSVSLMSTSLDASQMKQFIAVVKDTSAALGTDFSANIEHAVASLKTMDTRLLANMGIMVSMEELNKKMIMKFPGADPATLSVQQQQAALLDVIIDKTKMFAGANKEMSEKGLFAWTEFKDNLKDISIAIGQMFIPAWNKVAVILAAVTKQIKLFFENESVQKFGKVVALVVVPAMVLLLAVFTALTPIVGLVMKMFTIAPFLALTLGAKDLIKVLIGGGSLGEAFGALWAKVKMVASPFDLLLSSFKATKGAAYEVSMELKRMSVTGEATGKRFKDLFTAIGNVKGKLQGIGGVFVGEAKASIKDMSGIALVKEAIKDLKESFKTLSSSSPLKSFNEKVAAVTNAVGSSMEKMGKGFVVGIKNTIALGAVLARTFGTGITGLIKNFGAISAAAFTAFGAGIRVATAAAGTLLKTILPILIFSYALEKIISLIGSLKDKYIEHTQGSKELKDEVEALKKEYEGLAVAMDKANPKKVQKQGYQEIVAYAQENNMKGKDLSDKFLKDTGVKEAQSAGGRDNIRKIVDQKNAMKGLLDGISSVSIEFKKFSSNVTELSNKANDSYTKVKLYSEGLRTEEQAYEGMLSKAATLNVVDMDKYIKDTVEPERMKAVEAELNKARKRFASAPELKVVEENANKMFDAYIKLLKDPKKTQALLDVNRNNQLLLRQSMKSDTFANELTESLKLARGRILELQSKIADDRNSAVKAGLEAMLKIEEDSFAERYAFLKQSLTMEYELYARNRERLVAMFEADQLNKMFFKAADGARAFSVQVNDINKTDMGGIKKVDESLSGVTKTSEKFITAWETGNAVRNASVASLDAIAKGLGEIGKAGTWAGEGMAELANVPPIVDMAKGALNTTVDVAKGALDIIARGLGEVGKAGTWASSFLADFVSGIAGIKPQTDDIKSDIGDLLSMEWDLGKAATDTNIKLSEAAIQAAAAAVAGGDALKPVVDILKEFSSGGVSDGLKIASDSIEEIDAKLQQLSLNKLRFEFATLEIQTAKAIKSAEGFRKIWASNPSGFKDEISAEIDKQQGLMDQWVTKWTQASNQLVENQKNILNKQRESVQVASEFARKMDDVSRTMEIASRNIVALKHSIAQQTNPIVDAEQTILELQAQQAQAIGDIVGFAEKRVKLLEKTYDAQEKLADAAKAESEDTRLSIEDRINAAKREQELRKNMFQVGSELERMDPRKNIKPQAQLDRSLEIAKTLKDYLDKKNIMDIAAAELAKKIEEIKRETLIEEGRLNKLKFDQEMIVLAEERAAMKIQQAVAKSNQEDLRNLLRGLAKLDKSPEGKALVASLEDGFKETDIRVKEATAAAEEDKKKTLAALNITATSSVEQAQLIADQTKRVQALVELQGTANGILEAIKTGILSANEAKAKAAAVNVGNAYNVADERIAEEKRVAGGAPKKVQVLKFDKADGKTIYVANGQVITEETAKKIEAENEVTRNKAASVTVVGMAAKGTGGTPAGNVTSGVLNYTGNAIKDGFKAITAIAAAEYLDTKESKKLAIAASADAKKSATTASAVIEKAIVTSSGKQANTADTEKRDKEYQAILNYLELANKITPEQKDAYRGRRQEEYDDGKAQSDAEDRAKKEASMLAQNNKWQKLAEDAWKLQPWGSGAPAIPDMTQDINNKMQGFNVTNVNAVPPVVPPPPPIVEVVNNINVDKDGNVTIDTTSNVKPTDYPLGSKSTALAEAIDTAYGDVGNTWAGSLDWRG